MLFANIVSSDLHRTVTRGAKKAFFLPRITLTTTKDEWEKAEDRH